LAEKDKGVEGVAAMVTEQARTGIPRGAELPLAHLPGHRSLRQAGQVILCLLLTGLAAAAVYLLPYLLVHLVLAPAGGLGLPHPVPVPNPPPVPPGS
jgi:hypothetical protein